MSERIQVLLTQVNPAMLLSPPSDRSRWRRAACRRGDGYGIAGGGGFEFGRLSDGEGSQGANLGSGTSEG
jgi:hypothetical protein